MAIYKELYLNDKKCWESKRIPLNHQPEFDILDNQCYGYNQRIWIENLNTKNRLFVQLQRQEKSSRRNVICRNVQVSFSSRNDWVYPNRLATIAKWSVIEDLSKNTYQPISLQHIAAATSIKKLNSLESCELLHVFNIVKNKQIFIRAGPNHERKIYNFANIVKHFIYKKIEFEPIAPLEYFEHVIMNPVPFCIHCGIFGKIEKSTCWCNLCNFLRFVGVFTTNIEKSYHHTK